MNSDKLILLGILIFYKEYHVLGINCTSIYSTLLRNIL